MNKTVCIKCDDQGQYSVGEMEMPGMDAAEGEGIGQDMQPAQDLDDALNIARGMFAEGDGEMTEQDAMQSAEKGYNKAKPLAAKSSLASVFGG